MASCPNPIDGVSLTDCAAINYAATTPTSNLYELTYTGPRPELATSVLDLPESLQEALAGCTLPGCKAVSYDFSESSTDTLSSIPFIYDTRMTNQKNSAVILNDDVSPQPPVMSGLPGYEFFSTPFELRNLTNGGYIHVEYPGVPATGNNLNDCADTCNRGSDCAGFNFQSTTGTCTFLPTGPATSTTNQATPYSNDEWVRKFDSSNKGTAYRKKPLIRVNVNDTIPTYMDLSGTGRFCNDSDACNTVISNALTIGELQQFDTTDFEACSGCPGKKYRTSGSAHTVTNEIGLARTFISKDDAKNALMYTKGSAAPHTTNFSENLLVNIKKLDGTILFSSLNSNVNGTGTVSSWVNSKNEARQVLYDPVDYIVNGYIITDMKTFEHYVPGNGSWIKELDPKYSPGYTSNVVVIEPSVTYSKSTGYRRI